MKTLRVFSLLVIASCVVISASAQDLVDAAIQSIRNSSRLGQLLAQCPSYQGMTPRGGCVPADPAGAGLRCGRTTTTSGGMKEICEQDIFQVLRGLINANVLARLEASSLNTARLYAEIEPLQSVNHDHRMIGEIADSCDIEYIKRKDRVKYRVAVFNSLKVGISISTQNWGTFQAEVQDAEGIAIRHEVLICGWKQHGEPRKCSPQ